MSTNAPTPPVSARSSAFTHALLILTGGYAVLAVGAFLLARQSFATTAAEADCPGLDMACALAPHASAAMVWLWYALAVVLSMLALLLVVFTTRIRSALLASGIAALIGIALPPLAVIAAILLA